MAMESLFVDDFSKGLDLASARNKIERGFTPDAMNFRISDMGGIEKVAGYSEWLSSGPGADPYNDLFYYENSAGTIKRVIAAADTYIMSYQSTGTGASIQLSRTAHAHTTFFQYEDYLYGINPLNNLIRWDGTTLTTYAPGANTGPPQGLLLGVWGNRMWVTTSTSMRVNFSEAGVMTGTGSWPTTNYVTLGGGSSTTEYIVGGIPTPDGLMVFTYDSIYLIYDQNTGANRLISADIGTTSRRSLVLIGSYVYGVSSKGIFRVSASGVEIISGKIAPLFNSDTPDNLNLAAGVRWNDSYLVSIGRNDAYNDIMFEVHTKTGSIMAFEYPATSMCTGSFFPGVEGIQQLMFTLGGSAGINRNNIMRGFDGGSFKGTAITAYYETPMDPFGDESKHKRLRRVRVVGQGTFTVGAYTDYGATVVDSGSVTPSAAALGEGYLDLSAGGRRHALRLSETGSGVGASRDVLGTTPVGVTIGDVQVSLIELQFTKSSRARTQA